MEKVEIKSAEGPSTIALVDREPFDTSQTIDYFTVQLTDTNLSASARLYAYMCGGLPELFAHVAENWREFSGPLDWASLEDTFKLKITHDGLGHFRIVAQLRSGPYDRDWLVQASVMAETSQLSRIAADIAAFLGTLD